MKFRLRPLLGVTLLIVLLAVLALILAVDRAPVVWKQEGAMQPQLSVARDLIRSTVKGNGNHDKLRQIALTQEDLTAVVNFALARKRIDGYATVAIKDSRLVLLVSLKSPFPGCYLNIKLVAEDADPQARIRKLRVGRIALPGMVVRWAGWWLMQVTPLGRYGQLTAPLLREVRIADERLRIALNWSKEALDQSQAMMSDLASRERMLAYHNRLAELLNDGSGRRYASLGAVFQELFALARKRSQVDEEVADENRALIVVVGAYVNGRDLRPMLAEGGEVADPGKRGILLNRRIDVAQHFMASAALAISGHRALADMVGLAKEINDTHSGSGFSFIDLAADRAGTRFGKQAVRSAVEARRVQEVLSASSDDSVFMPSLRDLPENLSPAAFAERFRDIESAQFQQLKDRIEERIAACELYRSPQPLQD
ncbi:MAG: hypothetical protein FIA97_10750 [Methylococcaceae bacterium]|nr:hypothetical protein [Methylococcaceae bacterium]